MVYPFAVAAAWWRLYGFPWDPRLRFLFVFHDIGYWGKSDIDGEAGKTPPEFGAKITGLLFGQEWADLILYHSRSYARAAGREVSRLCIADKLSLVLTPAWLYLPMVALTNELDEYMVSTASQGGDLFGRHIGAFTGEVCLWLSELKQSNLKWVERMTGCRLSIEVFIPAGLEVLSITPA